MKIGIDARIWGTKHAGIGRYTEELVRNLQAIDRENKYVVFCRREDVENIPTHRKWTTVVADIPHYTFREQLSLPGIFSKENLDLLHVPHFNVPIFYKNPFIVTIHDILWQHLRGLDVTTLPAPLYLIKHFGYRIVLSNAIKKSKKIIVPSQAVKKDLERQLGISGSKVIVTYEGASGVQLTDARAPLNWNQHRIKEPYLFYVGSLYPHKNVEGLIYALKKLDDPPILVIASARNVFQEKFREFIKKEGMEDSVALLGQVSDEELTGLYKNAEAFVFPTLSEGFGLPGLEAMAAGTPVICSDIPVLHEIYGDAALYFNPRSLDDITDKIKQILMDKSAKGRLAELGRKRVKLFSWRKMAEETLAIYNSVR